MVPIVPLVPMDHQFDESYLFVYIGRVFLGAVFVFVRNVEFISKQPCQFFVFTFLSLQWEFSVHPCISIKFCCLIAFPPHPLAYYFIEVLLEVQVAMEAARGNPSLPAFNESTSKVTRLEMSL